MCQRVCVCAEDWWTAWCKQLHSVLDRQPPHKRSEAGTNVQRWYETMIVADKKFLAYHKDYDVEEYIICIMNMVKARSRPLKRIMTDLLDLT